MIHLQLAYSYKAGSFQILSKLLKKYKASSLKKQKVKDLQLMSGSVRRQGTQLSCVSPEFSKISS